MAKIEAMRAEFDGATRRANAALQQRLDKLEQDVPATYRRLVSEVHLAQTVAQRGQ